MANDITLNFGFWAPDPAFNNELYYIENCIFKEDPYSDLPDGCKIIPYLDFCDQYPNLHMGPKYFIRNAANMQCGVASAEGIPLFFIGDFIDIDAPKKLDK
jgi:hypothetical protein